MQRRNLWGGIILLAVIVSVLVAMFTGAGGHIGAAIHSSDASAAHGSTGATTSASSFSAGASGSRLGPKISALLAAAKSQLGAAYADVGDTPQKGFSCVGLVHWSYLQIGINVPESVPGLASTYTAVAGGTPAGSHLAPGDVLLFVNTAWAGYSHAAIYAGNGQMISADSPATGVILEPLDTAYWTAHWAEAVRIPGTLQDVAAPAP